MKVADGGLPVARFFFFFFNQIEIMKVIILQR